MSLRNYFIDIDRRQLFRLIWISSLVSILLAGGCATVDRNQYPEGPYIVSTYPSPGDFNISRYTDIHIRFSEAMDPDTGTGFEILSRGIRIEGGKMWSDSNTVLIFRPDKPLDVNGAYQGIMREGKSKEGKALTGGPYLWMFTIRN